MAITFREPKTGREQQVGENERVRISTLKRLGWKQTIPWEEAKAILRADGLLDAPAGVVTIEEELEPDKVDEDDAQEMPVTVETKSTSKSKSTGARQN